MFKKGQVIRGVSSGWMYLVLDGEGIERSFEAVVLSVPDGKSCAGRKVLIRSNRKYQLIGNNYQERPTKQVQPGTAFKRWLGEMTRGIPEQRGCRKEDC